MSISYNEVGRIGVMEISFGRCDKVSLTFKAINLIARKEY